MNILTKLRKLLTLLVCVSMSLYTLPSFASVEFSSDKEMIKIDLSDSQMKEIIGANGSVDATLADYTVAGSKATAVFTNRSTVGTVSYSLDVVGTNGNVLENLASGSIATDSSILVSGTPTITTNNKYIQARIWHGGLLGLESKDSSWAP